MKAFLLKKLTEHVEKVANGTADQDDKKIVEKTFGQSALNPDYADGLAKGLTFATDYLSR